jgi:hypothetical protein
MGQTHAYYDGHVKAVQFNPQAAYSMGPQLLPFDVYK